MYFNLELSIKREISATRLLFDSFRRRRKKTFFMVKKSSKFNYEFCLRSCWSAMQTYFLQSQKMESGHPDAEWMHGCQMLRPQLTNCQSFDIQIFPQWKIDSNLSFINHIFNFFYSTGWPQIRAKSHVDQNPPENRKTLSVEIGKIKKSFLLSLKSPLVNLLFWQTLLRSGLVNSILVSDQCSLTMRALAGAYI